MGVSVKILAGTSDGRTLQAFCDTLNNRMKYLNETARTAVVATSIDVLKSIRTLTRVAKQSGVKVEVKKDGSLYASVSKSEGNPKLCLRFNGTKKRYTGNETVVRVGKPNRLSKVYRYTNTSPKKTIKTRDYIIVANTLAEAKSVAKKIALAPILKYSGLAKKAIGLLMHKTASYINEGNEKIGVNVRKIANEVTKFHETVTENSEGGKYIVSLEDNLRYALDAVIGEKAGVDTAFQKALNKITGNINRKIKDNDFFGRGKLDTPFPEIKGKK